MMEKSELVKRIKDLTSPIQPKRFDHSTNLKKLSGIKCVAFDFYGTMFISGVGDIGVDEAQKSASRRFFKEALNHMGFTVTDSSVDEVGLKQLQDIIERRILQKQEAGIPHPEPDIIEVWQEVLAALVQLNFIGGPITEDMAVRFAIEFEFRANTIWPVPDLENILNELLNQGLKLGIISNSQFYTPLAFEALIGQTTDSFGFEPELQIWSFKHGIKKPSVSFYRKFTKQLPTQHISSEEVLYVGNDLFKDVIPANQLNMKTALYVGDRRSLRHEKTDLEDSDHQPDLIIDDLHQLLECV